MAPNLCGANELNYGAYSPLFYGRCHYWEEDLQGVDYVEMADVPHLRVKSRGAKTALVGDQLASY